MDSKALVAYPLGVVFDHLGAPAHLGDWLPEVTGVGAGADGIGATFGLRLAHDGVAEDATGELIAYQPSHVIAYRLFSRSRSHVIRVTCTSGGDATRVQVHQDDQAVPLAVDLAALHRALAAGAPGPRDGSSGMDDHHDRDTAISNRRPAVAATPRTGPAGEGARA